MSTFFFVGAVFQSAGTCDADLLLLRRKIKSLPKNRIFGKKTAICLGAQTTIPYWQIASNARIRKVINVVFRSLSAIRGSIPVLHKLVYELKYWHGMTYLDACGRTINYLMRQDPSWVIRQDEPSPQNAPLINLDTGSTLNFNTKKIDLSLERSLGKKEFLVSDVETFATEADRSSRIILESLGISDFDRIGFRMWFLIPQPTTEACHQWINQLGLFSFPESQLTERGARSVSFAVSFEEDDGGSRIALNSVERQVPFEAGDQALNIRSRDLNKNQREHLKKKVADARLNADAAVMIDMDVYLNDFEDIDILDFIKGSNNRIVEAISALLRQKL